jgi:hypothetical protein
MMTNLPALFNRFPLACFAGLFWVHLAAFLLGYAFIQFSVVAGYMLLVVAGIPAFARGLKRPDPKLFNIVKVVSILLTAWIMLPLSHGTLQGTIWQWAIWLLLALNITEAIIYDAVKGQWLNAISGSLLIACMSPAQGIVATGLHNVIVYPLPWLWLLAYALWNFCFSSRYYPYVAQAHLAMLVAPLLVEYCWPGSWLQARTYSMAVYFLFSFGFWDIKQHLHLYSLAPRILAFNRIGTLIAAILAVLAMATGRGWLVLSHG